MSSFFSDIHIFITIGGILLLTILMAVLVRKAFERFVRVRANLDSNDRTSLAFSRHLVVALIYVAGIAFALLQIPEMRIVGHSLLAGAGIISLVAGLASQQALSNIMSGILIVIFKPFRIGDKITISGFVGVVEDMNLRQVVLRDFENNRVIVPNSLVSSAIVLNAHLSDAKSCKMIEVGIGYKSDIDAALRILCEEVAAHPLRIDNRTTEDIEKGVPPVVARVVGLGDSSINLKVWAWAANPSDAFAMYCDLLRSVKLRFDREGIEIPFPQRVVTLAKDSPDPPALA